MLNNKLYICLFILVFNIINCQEKQKSNIASNKKPHDKTIKIILEKQLKQGANHYIEEPGVEIPKKAFKLEELNVSMFLADSLLKSNGYKTPLQSDFNKNIKLKLKRIIDNNSDKKYLYVNFFDKCDRNFNYFPYNGVEYNGIYIDKNRKIISKFYYIPELIDYQKNYPKISKIENQISSHYTIDEESYTIELWKDLASRNDDYNLSKQRHFNQQLILSLNKYLFNDDPSQLAWLINNAEYFMESLVTTFGYTEDKKLLNWVMEKNYNQAEYFIKNYVFVKNCQNKLEIREDILKYIEVNTNNKEYQYAKQLLNLSNRNDWKNFSDEEYFKILAYMANTYDPLLEKYSEVGMKTQAKWTILSKEYHERKPEQWNQLIKEFRKNNYYGLPNLKHALKQTESYGDISLEVSQ